MRLYFVVLLFLLPSVGFPAGFSVELDRVRVADLSRVVFGDMLKRSFVLDDEVLQVQDVVSLSLASASASEVESMARAVLARRGFELVDQEGVLLIRKRDDQDEEVLLYKPRFRSAKYLADILAKVAGSPQLGSRGLTSSPGFKAAIEKQPEVQGSAASIIDRGALDQLAFRCLPQKCESLRRLLADIDTPEAQVVLRAALYEVGTSKADGSAVQLVGSLLSGRLGVQVGAALAGGDQLRLSVAGLDAVFSVLDQDSRFKVLSRPMLRVRTGAEARFSVGQQVPVLGALSYDKNGNAVQSVDYRQSGTIFTVQPDIRANVIDLDITQELSSFVATTTGVNNSPTLLQRTVNSTLSISPGEVVVFAGLDESRDDQAGSGLFGFSVSDKSSANRSEVLLFIEAQTI